MEPKPRTCFIDGLFQRRQAVKITRTQYGLVIGIRATAKDLKAALAKIPDAARIIDEEDYRDGDAATTHKFLENGSVFVFEVEESE